MTTPSLLQRIWLKVPVLLRAAIVALVILMLGQLPPGIFLALGLRFTPVVPWFLAATMVWLWLFWAYLNGRGWPATTVRVRNENLRAAWLPARIWLWSLLAGGLGTASVLGGALLTGLVADLPADAYKPPFDLRGYPAWTVLAFFLNLALVAGVVEEAAFRGYMLSMIERRHGWVVAILSVALLFYLVHLSHAYATAAFIPFFAAYSLLHGLLVWLTRSILPSVVLHALGDFTILPMQFGIIGDPLGSSVQLHVLLVMGCSLAALLAFLQLRRAAGP